MFSLSLVLLALSAEGWQYPIDVAVDGDRLVVVDLLGRSVYEVLPIGEERVITEGTRLPIEGLVATRAIAANEGVLYIADSGLRDVVRFDGTETKPLTEGQLGIPATLAIDDDGSIIVGELESHSVLRIHPETGFASAVFTNRGPRGVATDETVIYSLGAGHLLSRYIDAETMMVVVEEQPLKFAGDVAGDRGQLYLSDSYDDLIAVYNRQGERQGSLRLPELRYPVGLAAAEDVLFVACPKERHVLQLRGDDLKATADDSTD